MFRVWGGDVAWERKVSVLNSNRKTMPDEKTVIGVPEDVAEKLKRAGAEEEVRDILDDPGSGAEVWVDSGAEKKHEKTEARYVSAYERKLKELQSGNATPIPPASSKSNDNDIRFDADAIRHMEDAEGRVQKLLDLALAKGTVHAVRVAEHIDAYTLDRTHDRLADELSDELRKKGMLDDRD